MVRQNQWEWDRGKNRQSECWENQRDSGTDKALGETELDRDPLNDPRSGAGVDKWCFRFWDDIFKKRLNQNKLLPKLVQR